jgi:hypothetical protein
MNLPWDAHPDRLAEVMLRLVELVADQAADRVDYLARAVVSTRRSPHTVTDLGDGTVRLEWAPVGAWLLSADSFLPGAEITAVCLDDLDALAVTAPVER